MEPQNFPLHCCASKLVTMSIPQPLLEALRASRKYHPDKGQFLCAAPTTRKGRTCQNPIASDSVAELCRTTHWPSTPEGLREIMSMVVCRHHVDQAAERLTGRLSTATIGERRRLNRKQRQPRTSAASGGDGGGTALSEVGLQRKACEGKT